MMLSARLSRMAKSAASSRARARATVSQRGRRRAAAERHHGDVAHRVEDAIAGIAQGDRRLAVAVDDHRRVPITSQAASIASAARKRRPARRKAKPWPIEQQAVDDMLGLYQSIWLVQVPWRSAPQGHFAASADRRPAHGQQDRRGGDYGKRDGGAAFPGHAEGLCKRGALPSAGLRAEEPDAPPDRSRLRANPWTPRL